MLSLSIFGIQEWIDKCRYTASEPVMLEVSISLSMVKIGNSFKGLILKKNQAPKLHAIHVDELNTLSFTIVKINRRRWDRTPVRAPRPRSILMNQPNIRSRWHLLHARVRRLTLGASRR